MSKRVAQAIRWSNNVRVKSRFKSTMSSASEHTQDAMTAEELATNKPDILPLKRPNAFTEMMAGSKKAKPIAASNTPAGHVEKAKRPIGKLDPRHGLGVYVDHPEANPEGRVVEFDDDFVVINDKFPKASVHLLLIPRNPKYYNAHPLDVLSTDTEFLHEVKRRVARLEQLAASELRRQYGHFSKSDEPYQAALETLMSSPNPPTTTDETTELLPTGRDWLSDVITGVHTHPSMSHMHVHIFSRDMHSPWLKHKKHYLSFNSSFLVQLKDFPLEEGNERFHPGNWPSWDMTCWRCGENFKNKFAALKLHLDDEFKNWRDE